MKAQPFDSPLDPETRTARTAESGLLQRVAEGDLQAAAQVLSYLTSNLADLRAIMQKNIHEARNGHIWRCLLAYLATSKWGDWDPLGKASLEQLRPLKWDEPRAGAAAQAIAELFVVDMNEAEGKRKELILIRALNAPRPICFAAAWLLGLRGNPEAIPILNEIITGGDDPTRAADESWQLRAVEALATLGDARGAPALLVALTNNRGAVHRLASRALRELGPAAEDVLQMALQHPDSHIRWHAARGLGQIGNLRGIQTLVEGLRDEHPAVRWATASTLADLDAQAIPFILRFLIDQPLSEPVRQAVYHALHAMPTPSTRQYLQPLLEALRGQSAAVHAPVIAQRMLAEWKPVTH